MHHVVHMYFEAKEVYEPNRGVHVGIFFKLMLITCVGVSLQGWNTIMHDEGDSVGLPIMWQLSTT